MLARYRGGQRLTQTFHRMGTVSVIIPAYSAAAYIAAALESVGAQSWQDWEILVVEDGTADGTDSIVKSFLDRWPNHRVEYIRHSRNQGVSAARNTAILASRGEWLAFLDHDDIWMPHHLENSVCLLIETVGDLCFCGVERFEQASTTREPYTTLDLKTGWIERLFLKNEIVLSSVVLRRTALDSALFDPNPEVQHCEDYDLWLRLAEQRRKFVKVHQVGVLYRKHAVQATSKSGMMLEREYNVLRRRQISFPLAPALKRNRCSELCLRTAMFYWNTDVSKTRKYLWVALCLTPARPKLLWLWVKAKFAKTACQTRRK